MSREANKVFQQQDEQSSPENPGAPPPPPPAGGSPMPSVNSITEYQIPIESIPLPTCGSVYPVNHPLHGAESVDVRAMTAKDEDILMSRALIKNGTVISKLLEACIVNTKVDARSLISGDRNALMVGLRTIGYGADYTVEITCPECDNVNKTEFDLTRIPIKTLDIEPQTPGENVFGFVLPMSKRTVQFRFLTGKDEEEINRVNERKKKKGFAAETPITDRLVHSIVSIDGETDRNKITNGIRNMLARDSLALRKYIDKYEPGVDMSDYMSCNACGEESKVNIPLGAGFFWPDFDG